MAVWKATERPRIIAEQTMTKMAAHLFSPPISAITINTSMIAAPMMMIKLPTTVTWIL